MFVTLKMERTMAKPQVKKFLAPFKVLILAASEDATRLLGNTFSNRGAKCTSFTDIDEAKGSLENNTMDVVLCAEKGFERPEIESFIANIRTSRSGPKVIWTIGESLVPLADGFSSYPIKPSDLLKPIYYSLLIHEDLYASS